MPALSHIWVLIVLPPITKLLVAKSTPTVGFISGLKSAFLVNRLTKLLLPTCVSPTKTILNR